MANGISNFLLQQLAYQAPLLLVYAAGLIASAVMLRRARTASILCLMGCGISILTLLALSGVQAWLFDARSREAWPVARHMQALSMIGLVGAILRPIGLALILVAVFIGRGSKAYQQEG